MENPELPVKKDAQGGTTGFSRSLSMALLKAREAVLRRYQPTLQRMGITLQQWRVLRALAASDGMEVTELAQVTYLLMPSLSRILKHLETQELIFRRSPDRDQRRYQIFISEKGRMFAAEVDEVAKDINAEIRQRYGHQRLELLKQLLEELESSLD